MLPISVIVHPTDFSEHSANAFQLAGGLARDYGARLILLHVVAHPTILYGEGVLPPSSDFLRERAAEQLAEMKLPDPTVVADNVVEEGDAAFEILRLAQDCHADLIVMGTHGRTGLSRLLMGSVAEQVMRKAPCPVVTVSSKIAAPLQTQTQSASVGTPEPAVGQRPSGQPIPTPAEPAWVGQSRG